MPTIRDVAKACGVSPMAVSFVLNNKPGQVSEETRERILRAVREMAYRPRAVERHRKAAPVLTLGMVTGVANGALVTSGYYTDLLHGLVTAADDLGHNLTVFSNRLFRADIHQSIRAYCDGRCDGLLLIAPSIGNPVVPALRERGTPFVLVGDTGEDPTLPCADVANVLGGRQATEYLLESGHRRIAFLGGPDFVHSSLERRQGYQEALAEAGIPARLDWTLHDMVRPGTQVERLREIMGGTSDARPTALFCWNDETAHVAAAALRGMGLRVPEDVSLIGFNDDAGISAALPGLTTFRQPYDGIARHALGVLAALARHEAVETPRALLPAELVVRGTVGPPSPVPSACRLSSSTMRLTSSPVS